MKWLRLGTVGITRDVQQKLSEETDEQKESFYKGVRLVLEASRDFIKRYG